MKRLFLIGGTMGVGKTTTCRLLQQMLPRCVFLDGDWCWDMHPFTVTPETKAMVMDNICCLLRSFLRCSAYENIVFCWVMHQQQIIDEILSRLPLAGCEVRCISLVCSEQALRQRLEKDVQNALRSPDVIDRSLVRIPLYEALHTQKLDVSTITPAQAAQAIFSGSLPDNPDNKEETP